MFFFKRKTSFDAAYDAAATATSATATPAAAATAEPAPVARREPAAGAPAVRARASGLGLLLALLLVLVEALALGGYWFQSQRSAQLLQGLGALRAAARAAYNSQQGYGRVAGASVRLGPGTPLGADWPASAAQLRSRVSTFSLSLDGVSPLVCLQVLPQIDNGWSELRYNGELLSLPVAPESARNACGYWRSGRLELLSSG